MLALLPWLTLTALVFAFRRRGRALGTALVAGLVWWSALLALGSEGLGQGHALTRSGVVVYWVVLSLLAALWAVRSRADTAVARAAPGSRSERALAIGVGVVLALALLTTVLVPANGQDVMTYHMPRVLHWVQNASLEPFPTSDTRQLYHPPFAELVDLHFYLLLGRDQWVGPSRVLFLAGAAIAAGEVARRLAPEGGRLAAVGAAVIAVSAPLTLGSVLGGKNDPVVGFFLLAMVLALLAACEQPGWAAALEAGLALGLALLTKTTAFLFAPPFVALFLVVLILRHRRRAWRPVLSLFALPPLLMAGHMARNLSVYGHPVADPARVELLSIVEKSPGATLSNVLRLTSAHLGGPWESWNRWLERGVHEAHGWFGLDADDRRTTYAMEHFGVDNALRLDIYAGSPAHYFLALLALGLVVSRPTLRRERTRVLYGLALAGAALLMCASLRWSTTVTRLESPLFLLAAPLIGVALAGSGAWRPSLYALLLVAALPWILCATGRAVIGPSSVLSASPRAMLYASMDPGLWKPAAEAATWIGAQGHHTIGLQPDDSVIVEYPLWLTLKEHVPGLRLEHVNATGASAGPAAWPEYRDFVPDVVLRVTAHDLDQRRPLEPQLMVGKQAYALRFQNERLGVYERSER
jgi:hypothetical protein